MKKAEQRAKNPEAFLERRRKERQKYRERTGTRPDGGAHFKRYSDEEVEQINDHRHPAIIYELNHMSITSSRLSGIACVVVGEITIVF